VGIIDRLGEAVRVLTTPELKVPDDAVAPPPPTPVAGPELPVEQLVTEVAALLGTTVKPRPEQSDWTLEIATTDGKAAKRSQVVVVWGAEDTGVVWVLGAVGVYTSAMDLPRFLRQASGWTYARLMLRHQGRSDREELCVTAAAPRAGLDARRLAAIAKEVADVTDGLENAVFGVDKG
jgi:hypothetical protein